MPKVRPRDRLAFATTHANIAKDKLAKGRNGPNGKVLQLAYRDSLIALHECACDYFGDRVFDYEKEPDK